METSNEAGQTEPVSADALVLRYAQSDEDVVAIHQFLCVVARPALIAPIDAEKSVIEVLRVVRNEVALMAIRDGFLVGTLGLIQPSGGLWYSKYGGFLTDRWFFALEHERNGDVSQVLEHEAERIAAASNLPLIWQGKLRSRKPGVYRLTPKVIMPDATGN